MAASSPQSQISATKIQLSSTDTPGYTHVQGLTSESAEVTSNILTENHELYHTRWKQTFHNHTVHHLLALWALGASPTEIKDMWEYNKPYQSSIEQATVPQDPQLKDPKVFDDCLGKNEHYSDFMRFFEGEIAEHGVPSVLKEYLLKGDERADDIFGRMYTDLVHPIIHLGCGIEFHQPSLVAEALAGACVHENWPKHFLLAAEENVRTNDGLKSTTLLDILDQLRSDPVISTGVKSTDPFNKIPDGLLKRITPEQWAPYLGQFQVKPTDEDLHAKMTEMMQTCAYMMGAAQKPGKRVAMDFVLLHAVTLMVFYPAILAQDWLTNEDKARLLEAKARVDAVMYAGCGCPPLYAERILEYQPRHPEHGWPELFHRSIVYRDEGHAAKLIRALFSLESLGETAPGFPIAKSDFITIAHMSMDSIEVAFEPGGNKITEEMANGVLERVGFGGDMVVDNMTRWVFYGGLDNAWDFVPEVGAPAS
ncbi:Oxidoreductase AflY [Cytospora mali]|uniref:Oxidoreductase AflY n=1 Tax=Cytospora mali TaxID=578113 RepID=A0A194VTG2_CYTMA|nr:Oxidoreductase AflY [Valsa mali]